MDALVLRSPTHRDLAQIEAYRASFPADRARVTYHAARIPGLDRMEEFDSAEAWLAYTERVQDRIRFFMTVRESDGKIVGFCCLRRSLADDDDDADFASHIGYSIRPDEQGRGYGKAQLRLALEKAWAWGFSSVRIVCVADNERSRRTIISCGGRYVDSIRGAESGLTVERYDVEPAGAHGEGDHPFSPKTPAQNEKTVV